MTDATSTQPRTGAQAVERALAVLRCFERGEAALGITELATRTGLTVSTVHRLVRALTEGGLLVQDPRSERYQLGPTLVVLGRQAEEQLGYGQVLPLLEELAEDTGESINMGIRTGNEVQVVLDVASSQPLRFAQEPGTRVALHVSAMGKCLLAYGGDIEEQLDQLGELSGVTERTITDRGRLADELEQVRRRGWALNDEERNQGVRAIAVPVLHYSGKAVAAVAVQGPTVRITDDRMAELAELLGQKAARIAPLLVSEG